MEERALAGRNLRGRQGRQAGGELGEGGHSGVEVGKTVVPQQTGSFGHSRCGGRVAVLGCRVGALTSGSNGDNLCCLGLVCN